MHSICIVYSVSHIREIPGPMIDFLPLNNRHEISLILITIHIHLKFSIKCILNKLQTAYREFGLNFTLEDAK